MGLSPPRYEAVREFIENLASDVLHPKQVDSLAHAVTGVLHTGAPNINAIGRAAAQARSSSEKHSIKQVDRLLGNSKVDVLEVMRHVVPILIGERKRLSVALEWTEFASDGQSTVAASMMAEDGSEMPLGWMTMGGKKLERRRSEYEDRLRRFLRLALPESVHVTFLARQAPRGPGGGCFGVPLQDMTLGAPGRRDRMLFVLALARMFRVLTGADESARNRTPAPF